MRTQAYRVLAIVAAAATARMTTWYVIQVHLKMHKGNALMVEATDGFALDTFNSFLYRIVVPALNSKLLNNMRKAGLDPLKNIFNTSVKEELYLPFVCKAEASAQVAIGNLTGLSSMHIDSLEASSVTGGLFSSEKTANVSANVWFKKALSASGGATAAIRCLESVEGPLTITPEVAGVHLVVYGTLIIDHTSVKSFTATDVLVAYDSVNMSCATSGALVSIDVVSQKLCNAIGEEIITQFKWQIARGINIAAKKFLMISIKVPKS